MKAKILLFIMLFATILFVDYILLIIFGCTAAFCGANSSFYCSVFCNAAIILIAVTTCLPFIIAGYKYFKKQSKEE